MEDERLYCQYKVEGMESVVATVTGYHGSERFSLIKMIASTGASYVGTMSQSITHLVCWEFEGRKYELAKKFNTMIVNHRWVEECVKKGCRVSEIPYTFQSGQEVGKLHSDVSLWINQASVQPKARKIRKEPLLDMEEEVHNDSQAGFTFSNELMQYNHGSVRPIGTLKTTDKSSRKDHHGSRKCFLDTVGSEPMVMEKMNEETSASEPSPFRTLKKRNSTSSKPPCQGRRLVKKQITMVDLTSTSKLEQDSPVVKVSPENNFREIPPNNLDFESLRDASSRLTSDIRCTMRRESNNDSINVDEIEVLNNENENEYARDAVRLLKTSKEHCEVVREDCIDMHCGNRQLKSTELSCVICWTDFSPTRGVLPCGHRFCFSCIQNWADQLASKNKPSTCPLCKAGFICITKVEDAISSDQKIYSQTIPNDNSQNDVYILPDESDHLPNNASAQVCFRCSSKEPVDLLVRCHYCQTRCVHSYCLDPPIFPWICVRCKDLQMLYLHYR